VRGAEHSGSEFEQVVELLAPDFRGAAAESSVEGEQIGGYQ
jgi:hypothetical protein